MGRRISNISINERMKQAIILVILIVVSILISTVVNAQDRYQKEREQHFKKKYSVQISNHKKECVILNKKRTELPRSSFFASNRRVKPKAMAEMDAPGTKR